MSNRLKKNQTEKKETGKTKKQVLIWEGLGLGAFVLGFVFILIPALLSDEEGHYEHGWIFLLLCFAFLILSVVILIHIFPEAAAIEAEEKLKRYTGMQLFPLENAGKMNVIHTFQKHGFRETPEGFYRKKKFSFWKDRICYYLACADTADSRAAADSVFSRIEASGEKAKNVCILLFLYLPQITKSDEAFVKDISSCLLIEETVLPQSEYVSMVPVLVEAETGRGRYLKKDRGISLYAYGCRMLRKYLARTGL